MTDRAAILKALGENNPFTSSAAGDPREPRFPDVAGLGDDVFDGLRNLITQKAKAGHRQFAAVVLGEAGSGKTHLIGRLIDHSHQAEVPYTFSYILPFVDPSQAVRYLLREIVANLIQMPRLGPEYSQLEILAALVFSQFIIETAEAKNDRRKAAWFRSNPLLALETDIVKEARKPAWISEIMRMLLNSHPDLNREFVRVLLQYYFYRERRPAAIRWMTGRAVDAGDVKLLGVKDRSRETPAALEQEALDILSSLDLLLFKFSRPLVVFFDQLENLGGKELIEQFERLVFFLSDTRKAMLPVAFFRGQDWETRFKTTLNQHCVGRLEANSYELRGCNRRQAQELLTSRLDFALAGIERPNDLYPLSPDHQAELDRIFRLHEVHPRQVIYQANRILMKILNLRYEPRSDKEVLSAAFETRYQEVLAGFDEHPPDEGRLTLAIELYLANRPADSPYQVQEVRRSSEVVKYIDLEGTVRTASGAERPLVVLVDVELHHSPVAASLRRGLGRLESGGALAVFLRDGRCPFPEPPKWAATNKLLDRFKDMGGAVVILDTEEAARLYALARLKFDVESGDVSGDDGRPLDASRLAEFVASVDGAQYPVFKLFDDYLPRTSGKRAPARKKAPAPKINSGLPDLAAAVLEKVPARMMSADLLADKVSGQAKQRIEAESLLPALGEHKNRFAVIRAHNGVIVRLNLEQSYA